MTRRFRAKSLSGRLWLVAASALLVFAEVLPAQVRPAPVPRRDTVRTRPDTTRRDTVRARARPDTSRRDTTAADSSRQKELIKWNEPDSIMRSLMARTGYTATRYQGNQAVFDARTRTLQLVGNKAGVNRDQTVLVGDSITYSDSTKIIVARGDTVI